MKLRLKVVKLQKEFERSRRAAGLGSGSSSHEDVSIDGGEFDLKSGANSQANVLESEKLMQNAKEMSAYFIKKAKTISQLKQLKGRGLMLGLEFNFPVAELRKKLLFDHFLFTGSSKNPNLIRILPPLTIQTEHIDTFFNALSKEL